MLRNGIFIIIKRIWNQLKEKEYMKINIAVCDDDYFVLEAVAEKIKNLMADINCEFEIKTYVSVENLLYDIEYETYFDIVFLDIEMPVINGMEATVKIHELTSESVLILISSHSKYVFDAFEFEVFRYITKDQIDKRLPKVLSDAVELAVKITEKSVVLKNRNKIENINLNNIVYIRKNGKYSTFILKNGETYDLRSPIYEVAKTLNDDFVATDRGCIVNLNHLKKIQGNDIVCDDGTVITISRSKQKEVKDKFINYIKGSI